MKADPKVRRNGKCAVCDKPLRKPKPQRGVPLEAYRDPFCSTECCRNYHGTELRGAVRSEDDA